MGTEEAWMDDVRSAARGRRPGSLFLGGWLRRRGSDGILRPHCGNSGVRPDLSWGTAGLPRFGATRRDTCRVGVPGQGENRCLLRRRRGPGRKLNALAALLVTASSALGLPGCHHSVSPDPVSLFQSIHDDFLHGNLDTAQHRADEARKVFRQGSSEANPTWELKFRLLDAEILLKQSHPRDVIALLTEAGVSFPVEGDSAIKRNVLCGLAHSRLGKPAESDQELREARRLAESAHSTLIGDVLRAEGLVLRDSGDLGNAMEKFRSSLAAAREYRDPLLEAVDRVDLGFVALQSGHYDQALVLSQEAANFAASIQARRQSQIALGNIGWAYQNLGDFENALVNFQAAEQQAKEIGMLNSQVIWLQNAGFA